jgi:hypothetical protein
MGKKHKKGSSAASKVLKDGHSGKASKSVSGSALSQKGSSAASKVLKDGHSGKTRAIGGHVGDRPPPRPPKD